MRKTRHFIYIIVAATTAAMMSCAGSTTGSTDTDTIANDNNKQKVHAINEYTLNDTVTVQGVLYTYELNFHTNKSAPTIFNYEGIEYYESEATLTIYQGKGSDVFYTHNFTKETLRQYVPEDAYDHNTLVGMNFNYMELGKHDSFHFIAVVGDPDETADTAYSVAIDISKSGEMSLRKVSDIDTAPISEGLNIDPDEDDA